MSTHTDTHTNKNMCMYMVMYIYLHMYVSVGREISLVVYGVLFGVFCLFFGLLLHRFLSLPIGNPPTLGFRHQGFRDLGCRVWV